MKKLLSLLTSICVVGTSGSTLVSCHLASHNSNDTTIVDMNDIKISSTLLLHNSKLQNWNDLQQLLLKDLQQGDSGSTTGNQLLQQLSFNDVNIQVSDQQGHVYTAQDFDKLWQLTSVTVAYAVIAGQPLSNNFTNQKTQNFDIHNLIDIHSVAFTNHDTYFKKFSLADNDDLTNFKNHIRDEYVNNLLTQNDWATPFKTAITNDLQVQILKTDGTTPIANGQELKAQTAFKAKITVASESLYLVSQSSYVTEDNLQLTTYDLNDLHNALQTAVQPLNILDLTPNVIAANQWQTILTADLYQYLTQFITGLSAEQLKSQLTIDLSKVTPPTDLTSVQLQKVKITPTDNNGPFENSGTGTDADLFDFNVARSDSLSYSNQIGAESINYNAYFIATGQTAHDAKMYVSPAWYSDLYVGDSQPTLKFKHADSDLLTLMQYAQVPTAGNQSNFDITQENLFAAAGQLSDQTVSDAKLVKPADVLLYDEQTTLELNLINQSSDILHGYQASGEFHYHALIITGFDKENNNSFAFNPKDKEIHIGWTMVDVPFNVVISNKKITTVNIDSTNEHNYVVDSNIKTNLSEATNKGFN